MGALPDRKSDDFYVPEDIVKDYDLWKRYLIGIGYAEEIYCSCISEFLIVAVRNPLSNFDGRLLTSVR